eukprot:CAMPEP_0115860388 /NCGR_PEP_ID=MMETSP0287-20121206/17100_1 /TAXON_ID=412157 /ORGANISM="Chrysochromulina rotalis, Strain UIO044" /LENGTH=88 /DNA_ID=CAMNT_0003314707 /DNA_START=180 /DNA_END=446 /DNA_ORIENTATION=+
MVTTSTRSQVDKQAPATHSGEVFTRQSQDRVQSGWSDGQSCAHGTLVDGCSTNLPTAAAARVLASLGKTAAMALRLCGCAKMEESFVQ